MSPVGIGPHRSGVIVSRSFSSCLSVAQPMVNSAALIAAMCRVVTTTSPPLRQRPQQNARKIAGEKCLFRIIGVFVFYQAIA